MAYRGLMSHQPTTLERAFVLARSGEFSTVGEIRAKLKLERHDAVEAHLSGASINRQLRQLCLESRPAVSAA